MKSIYLKLIIAFLVILMVTFCLIFLGQVKVDMGEEELVISGTFTSSTTVKYSDIQSIDFVNSFEFGKRDFGFGTFKVNLGTYSNNQFNKYKAYAYSNVKAFVVVYYSDNALVFNQPTVEDTKSIYNELKSKILTK